MEPRPPAPGPVDLVHIGSISATLEPGSVLVRELASSPGPLVSYDPNIRPTLIADPARTRRDVLTLISAADIVKVSDEDLAWIDPGQDPERVIADWLQQGPVVVIATRGAAGAAAMTAAGRVEIAALAVEIADTVGAGDTLVGAFLSALVDIGVVGTAASDLASARRRLEMLPLAELEAVLAYSTAAAAVTISRAGADPPWPDEIQIPLPATDRPAHLPPGRNPR